MTKKMAGWLSNDTEISPEKFEEEVKKHIRLIGAELHQFDVRRREKLVGGDGEYEIDVLARFEALNANFIVLIECKKHKHSIKREVVQILRDRLRSVGAQKAMLFSTAGFQSGAVEYARKHGIALVQLVEGKYTYFTKSQTPPSSYPPDLREFACYITYISKEGNESYWLIHDKDPEFLISLFNEEL